MAFGRLLGCFKHFGRARAGDFAPTFAEWATVRAKRSRYRRACPELGYTGSAVCTCVDVHVYSTPNSQPRTGPRGVAEANDQTALVDRELELELILSRWLWERGEKGGASLQKQARVRALCGVMQ